MTEMAKGDWWLKLDINHWLNDLKLRKLRRENRDSWLTACLLMRLEGEFSMSGTARELADALHLTADEFKNFIADLQRTNAATVTRSNKIVTLLSRRYEREAKSKEYTRLRVRRHREKTDVTPKKRDKSKKLEIKSKKQEEEKDIRADGETPPQEPREIDFHIANVLVGVKKELDLKKLSVPEERDWSNQAILAFENDFTAADFLECFALMRKQKWRTGVVKPANVRENLSNLANLRKEVKEQDDATGNGRKEHPNTKALREWTELAERSKAV